MGFHYFTKRYILEPHHANSYLTTSEVYMPIAVSLDTSLGLLPATEIVGIAAAAAQKRWQVLTLWAHNQHQ